MTYKVITVSREELYEKVWDRPVREVAKEYGISDVGLAKVCKRLMVPLPGVGFWQRKNAGYKVKIPKLPPHDVQHTEMQVKDQELEKRKLIDEKQYAEALRMIEFENKPENLIKVPARYNRYHPLVSRTKKILEKAKTDEYGRLKTYGAMLLAIHVSPKNLSRALRVMNALILAMEARGLTVTIGQEPKYPTMVSILGKTLHIGIVEPAIRYKIKPEPDEEISRLYGVSTAHKPSGRLSLRIGENYWSYTAWTDGEKRQIESCLNSFLIGIINKAVEKRSLELEGEKWRREWEEQERIRREEQRRREEEEARIKALLTVVSNWNNSLRIREYLEAFKNMEIQNGADLSPESEKGQWLQWASQYADELDPLK